LGQTPSSRVEIAEALLDELELADDGSFHGIGMGAGVDSKQASLVGHFREDGAADWLDAGPPGYRSTNLRDKLVRVQSGLAATLRPLEPTDPMSGELMVYSASAGARSLAEPGASLIGQRHRDGLLLGSGNEIAVLDGELQKSREWVLPPLTLARVRESASGDLLAIDAYGNFCFDATLTRLTPVDSSTLGVAWQQHEPRADWEALAEAPDGRVLVGGRADPRATRRDSTCEPSVRAYSDGGELLWEYRPEALDVDGVVQTVTTDAQGNVYVASTEDPVSVRRATERDTLCTVYGCAGAVLRKLSPEGTLIWEHQHREASGIVRDLKIDPAGKPLLLSVEYREQPSSVLLRFEP
jgi:hypothetical protein